MKRADAKKYKLVIKTLVFNHQRVFSCLSKAGIYRWFEANIGKVTNHNLNVFKYDGKLYHIITEHVDFNDNITD